MRWLLALAHGGSETFINHFTSHSKTIGDSVLVTGLCDTNLHFTWDTCLVLKAIGEDVGGAATEL
jgi:hypothetical protein